ncbi:MAG: hypothetical protein JO051_12995, partial [Acidobacteriaceae bacterium]|nr:hypothetical protein [Acidobacteriaceae bacterium]
MFSAETARAVSNWYASAFRVCTRRALGRRGVFVFSNLAVTPHWRAACPIKGMTLMLIVIALQVVVTLVSLLRESGEDARFE